MLGITPPSKSRVSKGTERKSRHYWVCEAVTKVQNGHFDKFRAAKYPTKRYDEVSFFWFM